MEKKSIVGAMILSGDDCNVRESNVQWLDVMSWRISKSNELVTASRATVYGRFNYRLGHLVRT